MDAKATQRVRRHKVLHQAILRAIEDPRTIKPSDRAFFAVSHIEEALAAAGLRITVQDHSLWAAEQARQKAKTLAEIRSL